MSTAGKAVPDEGSSGPGDPLFRAKYLDYCSARVAEVLLRLTADEMYVLARDVARESGEMEEDDPFSYDEIVRLATWRISQTIVLPTFQEFRSAYRDDPDQFEEEMLGLWEKELPEGAGEED